MVDDLASPAETVSFVDGQIVGEAADPGVHLSAAQRFLVDDLVDRHLDQWRTSQVGHRAAFDKDGVIAHPRDVGAPGRRRAKTDGNAGYPRFRQLGQGSKLRTAGDEDVGLAWQVSTGGFVQDDYRQAVGPDDVIEPQRLGQGGRVGRTALIGHIRARDPTQNAFDHPDPGDDTGADRIGCAPRCQRTQL